MPSGGIADAAAEPTAKDTGWPCLECLFQRNVAKERRMAPAARRSGSVWLMFCSSAKAPKAPTIGLPLRSFTKATTITKARLLVYIKCVGI